MNAALLCFALTLHQNPAPLRPPHPFALSLPTPTDAEVKLYEKIIDRFILADIGKLQGAEAKKAMDDFKQLPAAAFFQLLEGFNRAADMEHSCPAVLLAKKLSSVLLTSSDLDLLNFARENVGVGVKAKRHVNVIHDLKSSLLFRRGQVQRNNLLAPNWEKASKSLAAAPGQSVFSMLAELDRRQEPEVYALIVQGTLRPEKELQAFAQALLKKRLSRESVGGLKTLLEHASAEVRREAIAVAQRRKCRWGDDLIARLRDDDFDVVQAARRALVQLSQGQDFGPESQTEQTAAAERWGSWWKTARR